MRYSSRETPPTALTQILVVPLTVLFEFYPLLLFYLLTVIVFNAALSLSNSFRGSEPVPIGSMGGACFPTVSNSSLKTLYLLD